MKLKLHWQIFIALILGVLFAFWARWAGFEGFVVNRVAIVGTIFLRGLNMVIVPLIISSMICGVAGIGSSENFKRLSLKTFVYFILSTLIAVLIGQALVNVIKPGLGAPKILDQVPEELQSNAESLGRTLLGIIPTNPVSAMAEGQILPIIFFSLIFGYFVSQATEPYKTSLVDFFQGVFEVMMRLTHWVISFAPLGVFALIAKLVAQTGTQIFIPMASYILTIVLALLIHAGIVLPLLLIWFGNISPIAHYRAVMPAILMAFSTSSSSATLPVTMECVEKNAGVSNKISSFVLPLGATVNMNGTALYECVAVVFIAQAYGIQLSMAQQAIVVLMALLAAIGAAGIPMAGLVMMTIVLKAVGLPLDGIGLILAVDRVLDMMRTTVNVLGDTCGAVIIAKTEGETELKVLRHSK